MVAVTTAATRRYPVRDGLSAAPKGAVEALVRGIAAEEGRYGVRANCVGPGMLTDGMAARLIASGELDERALDVTRANIPLRAFGTAEDVAEAVCFLASDRARFITGVHSTSTVATRSDPKAGQHWSGIRRRHPRPRAAPHR